MSATILTCAPHQPPEHPTHRCRPLACVHFPNPEFGLGTFRPLREFRMMHETQYDKALLKLPKDELKEKLQDQKANSVAGLAAGVRVAIDMIE